MGTIDAQIGLSQNIWNILENKSKNVDVLGLHLEKAGDTVEHFFTRKLLKFGIGESVNDIVKSYLNRRIQFTSLEIFISEH